LPAHYANDGSNFASTCGFTEGYVENKPTFEPKSLWDSGYLMRLRISYKKNGVSKTAMIWCVADKVPEAIVQLLGKKYRGNEITSAKIPVRARLSA